MGSRSPEPTRVLVVDDEEDFATALVTRLARRCFDARAAFSGEAALALVEQTAFDVVVLDLRMPGIDGLETMRRIRLIDPAAQIIVLTGHGTVSSGIEGMRLGAADFLQKPVAIETLCTAVEAAAGRAREMRAAQGEGGTRR